MMVAGFRCGAGQRWATKSGLAQGVSTCPPPKLIQSRPIPPPSPHPPACSIFFVLTGLIVVQLLQLWAVHTDWVSLLWMLWNFAAVGSATLFFFPAPLLWKQAYLIVTGACAAAVVCQAWTLPHALLLSPLLIRVLTRSHAHGAHAPAAGIVTAYVFTWIPEWTTWVLLLTMAVYDVLAGGCVGVCGGGGGGPMRGRQCGGPVGVW